MTWQCKLIEYVRGTNGQTLNIGDMFFGPTEDEVKADEEKPLELRTGWYWPWFFCMPDRLSEFYRQHNAGRRPLLVWLPGRELFCVDAMCWNEKGRYGGWQVTGEAPLITVSPSINIVGFYHGFLQNGVISDDVDGRKYDTEGRAIR